MKDAPRLRVNPKIKKLFVPCDLRFCAKTFFGATHLLS